MQRRGVIGRSWFGRCSASYQGTASAVPKTPNRLRALAPDALPLSLLATVTSHTPALLHPPTPRHTYASPHPETAPPDVSPAPASPPARLLPILLNRLKHPPIQPELNHPQPPAPHAPNANLLLLNNNFLAIHQLRRHRPQNLLDFSQGHSHFLHEFRKRPQPCHPERRKRLSEAQALAQRRTSAIPATITVARGILAGPSTISLHRENQDS